MTPQIPLSEVQTLWLKELGISMLWGQALVPYEPETVQSASEPSSQIVQEDGASSSKNNAVALIKRSSPEGKTKAGRVSREQEQAIQEIYQGFQKQRNRQRRAQSEVTSIPVVHAQNWIDLEIEIRHQYKQWQWVNDEKEVLIGQEGKSPLDLLIIEEMPGADDYVEGTVFSGETGVLLANILAPLGMSKEDVAITSLLKIHLRDETLPSQYEQALPYLQAQIALLKPKCIWLLGARAAQPFLKQENGSMDVLRGQERFYPLSDDIQIPVVVSHHPSLLLIHQGLKADMWEDVQKINAYLSE